MSENAFATVGLATFSTDGNRSLTTAAQADCRTQPNLAFLRSYSLNGQNATYPMVLKLFYVG